VAAQIVPAANYAGVPVPAQYLYLEQARVFAWQTAECNPLQVATRVTSSYQRNVSLRNRTI